MNYLASRWVVDDFAVPIVDTINDSPNSHPFAGLALKIISDHLLHERSSTFCMARFEAQLALQ